MRSFERSISNSCLHPSGDVEAMPPPPPQWHYLAWHGLGVQNTLPRCKGSCAQPSPATLTDTMAASSRSPVFVIVPCYYIYLLARPRLLKAVCR